MRSSNVWRVAGTAAFNALAARLPAEVVMSRRSRPICHLSDGGHVGEIPVDRPSARQGGLMAH